MAYQQLCTGINSDFAATSLYLITFKCNL